MRTGSSSAIYKDRDYDDLMSSTDYGGKQLIKSQNRTERTLVLLSHFFVLKREIWKTTGISVWISGTRKWEELTESIFLHCLSCLIPGSEKVLRDLHVHLQELKFQFSITRTLVKSKHISRKWNSRQNIQAQTLLFEDYIQEQQWFLNSLVHWNNLSSLYKILMLRSHINPFISEYLGIGGRHHWIPGNSTGKQKWGTMRNMLFVCVIICVEG